MSRLLATVKLDVRLQARSKLYAIGIFVAILLGLAGRFFVHPDYAGRLLAVFFLTGLGGTTYFFGSGLTKSISVGLVPNGVDLSRISRETFH